MYENHRILTDVIDEGFLGLLEAADVLLDIEDVLDAGHGEYVARRSLLQWPQEGYDVLNYLHHEPIEGLPGPQYGIHPLHFLFV